MLPITGPFVRTQGSLTGNFYLRTSGYRQKRPYNLPTSVTSERLTLESKRFDSDNAGLYSGISANEGNLRAIAYAAAYKKLVDKLGHASIGAALATMSQSVSTIEARASQLLRFVKHLKRGNLLAAGRALGSPDVSHYKRHNLSKKISGQILEVNFGWVPLVNDLQSAFEILEGPIPIGRLRGRSATPVSTVIDTPTPYRPAYGEFLDTGSITTNYCAVTCGTDVRMTNPNLALATAMGLTDPMEVLFEITPWSFVLDWFSNASQFLTSWNDFFGYTRENSFSSTLHVRNQVLTSNRPDMYPIGRGSCVRLERSLGLPAPQFHWKPFRLPVTRAANIMSLLVQQLPRR